MYRDRIVFLYKPLDDQLANQLVATLLYLDGENQKDIFLYINCSGGDVSSALALHDTMRYIQSDVGAVAFGGAYGMAGFLLAGKRVALSNTRIMLHHPSGVARGQAADISRESRELLRTRDYINAVVAEATGKDPDTVAHDFRNGRYFNTREAQEYGIIDIIIIPREEARRKRRREEAEAARLAEEEARLLEEEGEEPGGEGASAEAGGPASGEISEDDAPRGGSSPAESGAPSEEDAPGPAGPGEHGAGGESTLGSGPGPEGDVLPDEDAENVEDEGTEPHPPQDHPSSSEEDGPDTESSTDDDLDDGDARTDDADLPPDGERDDHAPPPPDAE